MAASWVPAKSATFVYSDKWATHLITRKCWTSKCIKRYKTESSLNLSQHQDLGDLGFLVWTPKKICSQKVENQAILGAASNSTSPWSNEVKWGQALPAPQYQTTPRNRGLEGNETTYLEPYSRSVSYTMGDGISAVNLWNCQAVMCYRPVSNRCVFWSYVSWDWHMSRPETTTTN